MFKKFWNIVAATILGTGLALFVKCLDIFLAHGFTIGNEEWFYVAFIGYMAVMLLIAGANLIQRTRL